MYATVQLPAFHIKIEYQVIRGRIRLYVNPCDMVLFVVFSKWFLRYLFSSFGCVTNVFIAAKFTVLIFSCFYKLRRISVFLSEFLTNECDWKFILIWIFNNRKSFLDEVETHSIMKFVLKSILFIYNASLVYFCMLTTTSYHTVALYNVDKYFTCFSYFVIFSLAERFVK